MRSSKSRSRSKNNRNRNSLGNVVNRVFDSSGPEGKVRGTPQQIIDKYNQLARDATLSNDRVAAENFQQHAEHYLRLLSEAQREQDARREQQERENRERQAQRDRERAERDAQREAHRNQAPAPVDQQPQQPEMADPIVDPGSAEQPDIFDMPAASDEDSGLVETPESGASKSADTVEAAETEAPAKPAKKPSKPRAPRKTTAKKSTSEDGAKADKPRTTRSRKPKATDATGDVPAADVSAPEAKPESAPDAAE